MMKIAALIPLILDINNSVDILNLIPNVEEHNLNLWKNLILQCRRTWINSATQWDSNSILTNWSPNSHLMELVENSQLVEFLKMYLIIVVFYLWYLWYFKMYLFFGGLSYPSIQISTLNIHVQLEMNVILYNKNSNNCIQTNQ